MEWHRVPAPQVGGALLGGDGGDLASERRVACGHVHDHPTRGHALRTPIRAPAHPRTRKASKRQNEKTHGQAAVGCAGQRGAKSHRKYPLGSQDRLLHVLWKSHDEEHNVASRRHLRWASDKHRALQQA